MSFEERSPLRKTKEEEKTSKTMSDNNTKSKKPKNNPKFKSRRNKYGTTLRQINALLREVDIIEEACAGKSAKKEEKILDEFQQTKKDLSDKLKEIKANVKTQKNIERRVGTGSEAIKLKQQIKIDLQEAKELHTKLEEAYQNDKYRSENQMEDGLNREALKEREELVGLLKQDLDYTEHGYQPKNEQGRGYSLAREQRNRRKKLREEGKMSSEPQPLTQKQQQFIQMSIEKDAIIDEKLDIILENVKQVNAITEDVNNELKKQELILDEIGNKIDTVHDNLEKRNKQMKDILDQSGGLQRWCPIIILLVILLAVLGWIWQSLTTS